MKHYFLLISTIIFFNAIGFSQCEIPGGDFEEFEDISSDFEYYYDYIEIEEPILSSPHFLGSARYLFLFIQAFFSGETLTEDFFRQISGQYKYEPGANGTASAIQLKPDNLYEIADAAATFNCDSVPTALKGSFLHVGQETDSAYIFILFGDSIFSDSYEVVFGEDTTFTYAQVGASGELTIAGGDSIYTEFTIPITNLENEFATDSVFLYLIAVSDSTYLQEGNESYYVFDELRFVYDEPVSINDFNTLSDIIVFPNPVSDYIHINSTEKNIGDIKVFDQAGRLVLQQSGFNFTNKLALNELHSGIYILDIRFDDYNVRKKIAKL